MKKHLEMYLKQKGINTRKNFKCLSGSHEDRHPSMRFYGNTNKVVCFQCGINWDIYDLIQNEFGINYLEARKKLNESFGLYNEKVNRKDIMHINFIDNYMSKIVNRTMSYLEHWSKKCTISGIDNSVYFKATMNLQAKNSLASKYHYCLLLKEIFL